MPELLNSLRDWNTHAFRLTLKSELEHLPSGTLPLDKGVAQGGFVDDNNISATILSVTDTEAEIKARVGIFFTEIVINCGCGDHPMPTNAYCEMQLNIDKTTAQTEFKLLQNENESGLP
jgi:hypothetical protein